MTNYTRNSEYYLQYFTNLRNQLISDNDTLVHVSDMSYRKILFFLENSDLLWTDTVQLCNKMYDN